METVGRFGELKFLRFVKPETQLTEIRNPGLRERLRTKESFENRKGRTLPVEKKLPRAEFTGHRATAADVLTAQLCSVLLSYVGVQQFILSWVTQG